jgi:hypothetical protein
MAEAEQKTERRRGTGRKTNDYEIVDDPANSMPDAMKARHIFADDANLL